jgi:hypothetical protein
MAVKVINHYGDEVLKVFELGRSDPLRRLGAGPLGRPGWGPVSAGDRHHP